MRLSLYSSPTRRFDESCTIFMGLRQPLKTQGRPHCWCPIREVLASQRGGCGRRGMWAMSEAACVRLMASSPNNTNKNNNGNKTTWTCGPRPCLIITHWFAPMKRIFDKTGKGRMHRASWNIYEVTVEPIADSDSPTLTVWVNASQIWHRRTTWFEFPAPLSNVWTN